MVRVFAADDFVLSKGTPLASGSFGVVRVARHRGLGTLHAAKGLPQRTQLRPDSVQEELIRSEMVNHARASARSSYVSRFDGMFEDGSEGWTYLVQELCTGKTLQERGVPDAKEVAPITRALLHALAGCAEAGIVHNDVKPSNIMCGGSQQAVRLIDFGSSQQLPPGSAASARVRFATPAFAAPEVLQSGRCSQVSVGCRRRAVCNADGCCARRAGRGGSGSAATARGSRRGPCKGPGCLPAAARPCPSPASGRGPDAPVSAPRHLKSCRLAW